MTAYSPAAARKSAAAANEPISKMTKTPGGERGRDGFAHRPHRPNGDVRIDILNGIAEKPFESDRSAEVFTTQ